MDSTAREALRSARADARTLREAAREAAHHARVAGNAQVEALIADVEKLIRHIGQVADPETARVRARVADAVASSKRAVADGAAQVRRQAGEAWAVGDSYVHGQPWEAIGAAAVAGLIVGWLAFRR